MKRLLLSVTALAVFSGGAPAFAQGYEAYGSYAPSSLVESLDLRIDESARSGLIGDAEAYRLRDDVDDLRDLEFAYRRDGFTRWERDDLARRADRVRDRLFAAERYAGSDHLAPRDPIGSYDDRFYGDDTYGDPLLWDSDDREPWDGYDRDPRADMWDGNPGEDYGNDGFDRPSDDRYEEPYEDSAPPAD